MKRLFRKFIVLTTMLFAVMVLSSCKQESFSDVITLTTQDYDDGKAYMGGADVVYWQDGDVVVVNGESCAVSLNAGENDKATLSVESVPDYSGNYYVAFPAGYISSVAANGQLTFVLPEVEAYVSDGSHQVLNNLMAAHGSTGSLVMRNLCCMLRFSLASNADGMKICAIEVTTDKAMWGEMTAMPAYGGDWTVTPPVTSSGNLTRRLAFSAPVALSSTPQYFYLLVPSAGEVGSFTVRYYVENSIGEVVVYERTKSSSCPAFAQGHEFKFETVNFSGSTPANYTAVTVNGSSSNPYRVFSALGWTKAIALMGSDTNKVMALENDIAVTATVANFYGKLRGQGHTISLDGVSSLFTKMENGARVFDLTVTSASLFTSITPDGNSCHGFFACQTMAKTEITNCTCSCDLYVPESTSATSIGAFCGKSRGSIKNCVNVGEIIAKANNIGGIAGDFGGAKMSGCVNEGTVECCGTASSGNLSCGGLMGVTSNSSAIISDCKNTGKVTVSGELGSGSLLYFGGIVGKGTCDIVNCANENDLNCSVTSSGTKHTGGIVGYHYATSSKTMINCYNSGDLKYSTQTNNFKAGGLAGYVNRLNVLNSYAKCDISAWGGGGLIYECNNQSDNLQIDNCYYYGDIDAVTSPSNHRFRLVALKSDNYTLSVSHCYYPDGIPGLANTETDCYVLTDALTVQDHGTLVNVLNAHVPANGKSWVVSGGRVTFAQ